MYRPGLPIALLVLSCCLATSTVVEGQSVGDPRVTKDPRTIPDPRNSKDPRDADVKPGLEESLNPLQGPELFDQLYEGGNLAALSNALVDNQWELADYIYDQCDQWINLVKNSPDEPDAADTKSGRLKAKLRDIARLADSGLGDTRFSYYVDTIFTLSADGRVQREEQMQLLRRGASVVDSAQSKEEMLVALTPLRQSLSRALLLGNIRGQSRANALIARVQVLNNWPADARANAREAVRVGRSVRDLSSVWNGWATVMQASLGLNDFTGAKLALQEQHRLATEVGDEITAAIILEQLLELEEALGTYLPDTLIIYGPRIDQPVRRF